MMASAAAEVSTPQPEGGEAIALPLFLPLVTPFLELLRQKELYNKRLVDTTRSGF